MYSFVFSFGLSEGGAHAGVLVFSEDRKTRVAINFDEYKETKNFIQVVDGLSYNKGGYTRIDRAFKVAEEKLFTRSAGRNILNILTH